MDNEKYPPSGKKCEQDLDGNGVWGFIITIFLILFTAFWILFYVVPRAEASTINNATGIDSLSDVRSYSETGMYGMKFTAKQNTTIKSIEVSHTSTANIVGIFDSSGVLLASSTISSYIASFNLAISSSSSYIAYVRKANCSARTAVLSDSGTTTPLVRTALNYVNSSGTSGNSCGSGNVTPTDQSAFHVVWEIRDIVTDNATTSTSTATTTSSMDGYVNIVEVIFRSFVIVIGVVVLMVWIKKATY